MTIAMLWFALGASIVVQIPEAPPQTPPGFVRIDGSASPEALPDWLVWQNAFSTLALAELQPAIRDILALDVAEGELIEREARLQRERDFACIERLERIQHRLEGTGAVLDATHPEVRGNILRCRQETLDAADRVLAGLSDNGRSSVEMWLRRVRGGIGALVPEDDLQFFRLPR